MAYEYATNGEVLFAIREKASASFWDREWARKIDVPLPESTYVSKTTEAYVPKGGNVIDAGFGFGKHLLALERSGYRVHGIDIAANTVERLQELHPAWDLRLEDTKQTSFADGYFDAVWSLGVIEHFWNGYDDILAELVRICKPGGYLFVTFPAMNPNRYKLMKSATRWNDAAEPPNFYQFYLKPEKFIADAERRGLQLVGRKNLNGMNAWHKASSFPIRGIVRRLRKNKKVESFLNNFVNPFIYHNVMIILKKD